MMPLNRDGAAKRNHRAQARAALIAAAAGAMLFARPSVYGQCTYDVSIVAGPDCGGLGSPTLGRGINEAGQVAGKYTVCGVGARWPECGYSYYSADTHYGSFYPTKQELKGFTNAEVY